MKRIRSVIAVILVLLIVGGVVAAVRHHDRQAAIAEVKATRQLRYSGKAGDSVLVLLKQNAAMVATQNESGNTVVQNIDGLINGNGGTWAYYVNGKLGTVSPSQYKTKRGDEIVWDFQ